MLFWDHRSAQVSKRAIKYLQQLFTGINSLIMQWKLIKLELITDTQSINLWFWFDHFYSHRAARKPSRMIVRWASASNEPVAENQSCMLYVLQWQSGGYHWSRRFKFTALWILSFIYILKVNTIHILIKCNSELMEKSNTMVPCVKLKWSDELKRGGGQWADIRKKWIRSNWSVC